MLLVLILTAYAGHAQMITGVWQGKINGNRVEVKIIQNGDSLAGTSYYYSSSGAYKRYAIKGYFDQQTNEVVWWDDQLIKDHGGSSGKNPLLSVADFNCPGGGIMRLDGKASTITDRAHPKGQVNLSKTGGPTFPDEWDYVIDNYTVGGNDPNLIDSIALIATAPLPPHPPVVAIETKPQPEQETAIAIPPTPKPEPLSVEQKFTARKKVFAKEIPLSGDSLELRFYDNAEVDGDSISLFLNDQLVFTHVRLSDKPYTIKLAIKDLGNSNELTMVAENLGSIPPNTSYMVAIMGDQRYDAQLASTEESSAMIRLKK